MPVQSPPPPPAPVADPAPEPPEEAKTENFLSSRVEPHFGQRVPFQSDDRTRISLSASHDAQWNS